MNENPTKSFGSIRLHNSFVQTPIKSFVCFRTNSFGTPIHLGGSYQFIWYGESGTMRASSPALFKTVQIEVIF